MVEELAAHPWRIISLIVEDLNALLRRVISTTVKEEVWFCNAQDLVEDENLRLDSRRMRHNGTLTAL
jgi:hypothetical protein